MINIIFNEDCLETTKRMPDDFVDFVITSPPYNMVSDSIHRRDGKYTEYTDDLSPNDFFEWQKKVIEELLRITKNEIFYNIQMVSGNKLALFKLIGHFADKIKEVIIWDKGFRDPAMNTGVMNSIFEFILIFTKKNPELRQFKQCEWKGTVNNIIKVARFYNDTGIGHNAIMPLKLPRYLIQTFTKENDLIFDPYMGSGTTAIACIEEKRRYIGSEISLEYYEASLKRMSPYLTQYSLFDEHGY